jgi:urease accessory protein
MVSVQNFRVFKNPQTLYKTIAILGAGSLMVCLGSLPASAHHAFGGRTPTGVWEGFLDGLAHPVIGIDHLTFVIAAGLMAGLLRYGFALPLAFITAAIAGTGLHIMEVNLPFPELMIAASVLIFGGLLAFEKMLPPVVMIGLAAIAGIFHGYAYGETIIGAQMNPLVAYLLGFSVIQGAIAYGAYGLSKYWQMTVSQGALNLRFAGFLISGLGLAFTTSHLLG